MHKKLAIFFGFIPWIVFSEFYTPTSKGIIEASMVALLTTVVFDKHELKKGFWLPWASLIYFCLAAFNGIVGIFPFAVTHPSAVINLAIAGIVWLSLLVRQPFTLQYAKEEVDAAFWKNPLFLKINWQLTLMWAIMLTISALPSVFIPQQIYSASWFWGYGFNGGCLVLAFYLNRKMRDWIVARNFWQSVAKLPPVKSPYLEGGFRPVHDEVELDELEISGVIPSGLNGRYLRNGPNPYFTPYTYTYPIDGDGMIHQITLQNGKASYKNAFVQTKGLQAEIKAGKALYGGIALQAPPDPGLVGSEENKSPASIHVIKWQDKLLALYETTPAYLLDNQLNTLGEWQLEDSKVPFPVNAHHRIDPVTGQIYMFKYETFGAPLSIYEFSKDYELIKTINIPKTRHTMIHDLLITQNYIVVFDMPAVFNVANNDGSKPFFEYKPEIPVSIILIKRCDYSITTIDNIPSFFVYHFVNAYEENNRIIVDMVFHQRLYLNPGGHEEDAPPALYRGTINLDNKSYSHECLNNEWVVEFPNYNLAYCGQKYQYGYLAAKSGSDKGGFNTIMKYDFNSNKIQVANWGEGVEVGEATFIPVSNPFGEDDGYLVFFIYHKQEDRSDFVILNARDIGQEIARIKLPRRVPHGLHGSWISAC